MKALQIELSTGDGDVLSVTAQYTGSDMSTQDIIDDMQSVIEKRGTGIGWNITMNAEVRDKVMKRFSNAKYREKNGEVDFPAK